jgi:hypothetical protein
MRVEVGGRGIREAAGSRPDGKMESGAGGKNRSGNGGRSRPERGEEARDEDR